MEEKINGLIEKYEFKSGVLLDVINHKDTPRDQSLVAEASRRFVREFIYDLKTILKLTPNNETNNNQ